MIVDNKVDAAGHGLRLDVFIADQYPGCSRTRAGAHIKQGDIRVFGKTVKPGYRLREGDHVHGIIYPPSPLHAEPENIPLSILYADKHIIVLDKQAGLVVHPAHGNDSGTLVNALLYHFPGIEDSKETIRPGIVHRLDKDTSGVLVVARTPMAHLSLAEQFQKREVGKQYLALVAGVPKKKEMEIEHPIGRHPQDRKKMSVHSKNPKKAQTEIRLLETYTEAALVAVRIKTGRTHQIRVHLSANHYPILGDSVYGTKNLPKALATGGCIPKRQMLHAHILEIYHPQTGKEMVFISPVPGDMQKVIAVLRKNGQKI